MAAFLELMESLSFLLSFSVEQWVLIFFFQLPGVFVKITKQEFLVWAAFFLDRKYVLQNEN